MTGILVIRRRVTTAAVKQMICHISRMMMWEEGVEKMMPRRMLRGDDVDDEGKEQEQVCEDAVNDVEDAAGHRL